MDMDLATKIMVWLIGAFGAVMFTLGHVMTGNGSEGYKVLQAESHCRNTRAVGQVIDGRLHYVCGDISK